MKTRIPKAPVREQLDFAEAQLRLAKANLADMQTALIQSSNANAALIEQLVLARQECRELRAALDAERRAVEVLSRAKVSQ